mgnify:CR=1 FL=1
MVTFNGKSLELFNKYEIIVKQSDTRYKAIGTLESSFDYGGARFNVEESDYPNGSWDGKGFYIKSSGEFMQEPTTEEPNRYNKVGEVKEINVV